jgi:PBP1b-binding outer membrane lipoprotein LpoB
MKKLTVLLVMLLVAALLVGCTPKAPVATATPAPVVTTAPVVTDAPVVTTAPVAPVVPTATPKVNG